MGLETRCEANVVEKAALVLVQPLLGNGLGLHDYKSYSTPIKVNMTIALV